MYIHIYGCVCVYVYMYIYIYIYIHIYIYIYIYLYICIYVYIYMCVCVRTDRYIYVHMYTHIRTHAVDVTNSHPVFLSWCAQPRKMGWEWGDGNRRGMTRVDALLLCAGVGGGRCGEGGTRVVGRHEALRVGTWLDPRGLLH